MSPIRASIPTAGATFALILFGSLRVVLASEDQGVPLKQGDQVLINVFEEDSLSGTFVVGPDGNVVFPLLGAIETVGRRVGEIASEIEARLEDGYIRDAQVVVAVAEQSVLPALSITVMGEVAAPGQVSYPAEKGIELLSAIAAAGGVSQRGDVNRIELKRRSGGGLESRFVTLRGNGIIKLQDGDTLIVHPRPIVAVAVETITLIGEVKNPGTLEIDRDNPVDLIGAIAMAGGFTNLARPSKVIVRRQGPEGVVALEFNVSKMQRSNAEPFLLQPGDMITVPESIF